MTLLASLILAAAPVVAPQPYYGAIGERLANMLPRYHVLQHKLDDEISQRAWTNLVTYYDFDHSVFLTSDLAALGEHERTLDDELKAGDIRFGYTVYDLYLRRLQERIDFATNLLVRGGWDFTTNETYRVKRKDAPWPASPEEAEAYWRLRIKNEVLAMTISRELEKSTNETESVTAALLKKYRQYVTVFAEPDEEQILQVYLDSVARAYDPHTDYMSPASKEDFDMEMNLTLCGVGAVLSMDDGALKIAEVMPGGPIDRDGRIKEGDKIVGVQQDGGEMEDITWKPMKKTIKKIRGPKGSKVTLEVVPRSDPSGGTHRLFSLIRDEIKLEDQATTGRVETVSLAGRSVKLGYINLPSFYGTMDKRYGEAGFRSCALDVNEYLADFNAAGVEGLVLDLRGNGGGSLREAVLLSSLFVPRGPVVQIRDTRTVGSLPIPASNVPAFRKPLVVLIDRASASASEIVAGHLQDTGRAIVLGDTRSHGKGTVQTVLGMGPEKYGSTKITTARFYRVTGKSTQLEGVSSDIVLSSLLDSLDVGEDKLTYALPFSRILPADYAACWDLATFLPELKTRSEARLREDARYQKHLTNVRGMKALAEREYVPLAYTARYEMMKADRELRELDEDEDESSEEKVLARRRRNQKKKDDVVLDESLRILADLVDLNGGREVKLPKGWWE